MESVVQNDAVYQELHAAITEVSVFRQCLISWRILCLIYVYLK